MKLLTTRCSTKCLQRKFCIIGDSTRLDTWCLPATIHAMLVGCGWCEGGATRQKLWQCHQCWRFAFLPELDLESLPEKDIMELCDSSWLCSWILILSCSSRNPWWPAARIVIPIVCHDVAVVQGNTAMGLGGFRLSALDTMSSNIWGKCRHGSMTASVLVLVFICLFC
jgi:hypothetical protein